MPNPVMVVRPQIRFSDNAPIGRGCWLWCPACNFAHRPEILGVDGSFPPGPYWEWDGDLEKPTFSPSLLISGKEICHSFIVNGQWQFLSDSTHSLAGQTVDLVPLPDWLVKERNEPS